MDHTWKNIDKAPNRDSISNFIAGIKDEYLDKYPSFQSSKRIVELAPEKEYARRWYVKKAKFEFVSELLDRLRQNPKADTDWGKEKLQFLQRVLEHIKMSMNSDAAFASEEKKRQMQKREEEERERKRLNTWV